MNRLPRIVGIFAIVAGALMLVVGVLCYLLVQRELKDERIVVADDAESFAGDEVAGPFTAYSEAMIIKVHALELADGLTYAQLDRDDERRATVQSASFLRASLFTSVVSFGVATLVAGLGLLWILAGLALLALDRRLVAVPAHVQAPEPAAT